MRFLAVLLFCLPALARIDSAEEFPTKLAKWSISFVHMDTGDLRGCIANAKFGDLAVTIGNAPDKSSKDLSFRFVKDGNEPNPGNPGDQRTCGSSKDQVSAGHWRYSPLVSIIEYCDGKNWTTPVEANFKEATLLIDGKEVLKARESGHFTFGRLNGKPDFLKYGAWFQAIQDYEKKLARPGKAELRIDGLTSGPIPLGDLQLNKVIDELSRCERKKR